MRELLCISYPKITHYVKQSINQYGFFSHDVSEALFYRQKKKKL